ncbi:uncharacterized protein K452DRAFT_333269 [Aplosporella prunicola CBS 121167]|uniref:Uncharacterized protein n=1 Tax=Aplosporella prunicola CBS 121167 TaxID=1176127 RepID=A0A6A6BDV2_9PEZI|nr:uncharacterized protein K452DRAFT_333269 [Aplosporella prunicola CBS 121167]KAF2141563.1 hypothetical protein K452DRAFT_333269 [Aplosporella prunicola CBS 121167]
MMAGKGSRLWTPIYLQRKVLVFFIIVFVVIIAVLAILLQYSNTHQGFASADPKKYLLWQYGPTAVFTIVAAFWGQVEYRTKQLTPWKLITQSPQPVGRSLLLDFISPLGITTFIDSLTSLDLLPVSVAVGGGFALKLITILSTGLFVLQYTAIKLPTENIIATNAFGGSNTTSFDGDGVDHQAFSRLYGINNFSLPFPSGTTARYAYQNFNVSSLPSTNVDLIGKVDVFHSNLDCEILHLQHAEGTNTGAAFQLTFRFHSETCGDLELLPTLGGDYFSEWKTFEAEEMQCSDNQTRVAMSFGTTTVEDNSDDIPLDMINSSTVLCRAEYGISPGVVVLNTNSSVIETPKISIPSKSGSSKLPGVKPADLLDALYENWLLLGSAKSAFNSIEYLADYVFLVMPSVTWDDLATNPILLANGTDAFFQAFSAQLANIYFMEPANQTIEGWTTHMENRLTFRALSFGLIEGFLVLMIVLAAFMVFLAPGESVSRDPGPIEGTTAIIARSPAVLDKLEGTGASGLAVLEWRLAGSEYTSEESDKSSGSQFGIVKIFAPEDNAKVREQAVEQNEEEFDGARKINWYRPMAVNLPAKLVITLVPLALLIILEIFYQVNQKNNGICDLSLSDYIHYTYTLIPTTILVAVGLLFGSLDFAAKIFQPYQLLRRGCDDGPLGENYLGKIGLHCIWRSLWRKHFAVASSSLGMLFVPLLTIAASGLFYAEALPRTYDVQLSQTGSFEDMFPIRGYGGGANAVGWDMVNLLLKEDFDEPLFTYKTLAFPSLEVPSLPAEIPAETVKYGSIAARIPAFRARSNCTSAGISNVTYGYDSLSLSTPSRVIKDVFFNVSLPEICDTDSLSITVFDNTTEDIRDNGNNYIGDWIDLSIGKNLGDWSDGCPTNIAIFGQVRDGNATHLSPLLCTPYLETVDVDVVLNAKDLSFNLTAALPSPVETTASFNRNLSFFANIPDELMVVWADTVKGAARINNTVVDGFFAGLFHGSDSVSPADLLANDDATHAQLRAAIDTLYGRIFAQVINTQRVAVAEAKTPINAKLTVSDRVRLKQNGISTRVLEGFLAAMTVCAILTYVTLDRKGVLPKNPCSVAAVASLVAGSDMLEKCYPPGSEWMSGKQMREKGQYKDMVFSLGWWPGGRFGIDVGVADKKGLLGKEEREGDSS